MMQTALLLRWSPLARLVMGPLPCLCLALMAWLLLLQSLVVPSAPSRDGIFVQTTDTFVDRDEPLQGNILIRGMKSDVPLHTAGPALPEHIRHLLFGTRLLLLLPALPRPLVPHLSPRYLLIPLVR